MPTLKEISRKDFASDSNSIEHIQTGAIQRIADACELMAKNWQSLSNDVSYYKELSARKQLKINDMEHELRTIKGVRPRYKNQLDKVKNKQTNE